MRQLQEDWTTIIETDRREGPVADIHITRELLRAVASGDMPPRVLVELGLRHLTSLCPACRDEFLAFRHEEAARPATYDAAFEALPALLERHGREMDDQHGKAQRDFRELMRLGHEERLVRIGRSNARFRGAVLAERFLEESKKHMTGDARTAFDLAAAAEAVIRRSPDTPLLGGLLARAAAYMGNASRRLDDYPEARRRFALARSVIKLQGVTDPLVFAEVDSAEAVLHLDQRRFTQAEELLSRSIALYVLAGAQEDSAHPLVTLGLLHYSRGSFGKAIETTRKALDAIDSHRDRRLYVSARFNLALFLCEAGDHRAASEALLQDSALFREFPDLYTQLRLAWLEGKIAAGFGQLERAERAFRTTRDGFILQRYGYDAAMVSLDLALIYLKLGKTAEVRRLAEEMHEIFSADGVHREAVAALLLFEEAARNEALTVQAVEDLADYLRRARNNPALRFKKLMSS
jgi:tetratricopeptide (TPR) repeat protein